MSQYEVVETLQGSEEWDRLRAITPTASEFSKILTGGGKKSERREAYMRRLSVNWKYVTPTFMGNKWTDRGHDLEPVARQRFIDETGLDVREIGFVRRLDCGAGGSPDGWIYDAAGNPCAGVEIKCYNLDKHLSIVNSGVLPTENKPQVHGHLWLSGFQSWCFVLFCPEAWPLDFRIIEVTPDSYTRQLGTSIYDFCAEYMQMRVRYLAEYEVDLVNKKAVEMCPITMRLAGAGKTQSQKKQLLI